MGKEAAKLLIVYAITGVIVLLAIPVLGKDKVVDILGGTSLEVIMMFAIIGIPLGIYAFVMELRGKGEENSE